MNLLGLTAGATGAVTTLTTVTALISTGYTTGADGTQVPTYRTPAPTFQAQIQALEYKDIQQISALNIQGERRAVYVPAQIAGVIRIDQKGGDILKFPEVPGGPIRDWLAAVALETWPDWVKIAATLQDTVI